MEKNAGRTLLLAAGLASLLVWLVPPLRIALWPLTLFNTFIHELCHAVVAVLTGGQVEAINVNRDGSGTTVSFGGIGLAIASAGYVGAAVVGGVILALARSRQSARVVCYAVSLVLASSLVLVVRGDPLGWAVGLGWTLMLAVSARIMPGPWLIFFTRFLGFQLGLTALHSLGELLVISQRGDAVTDAAIIQSMTGVPPVVTSVAWSLTALVCVGFAIRRAWEAETDEQGASPKTRPSRV